MNKLTFILLKSIEDKDLEYIKENYANPSVERFVDINKEKYNFNDAISIAKKFLNKMKVLLLTVYMIIREKD